MSIEHYIYSASFNLAVVTPLKTQEAREIIEAIIDVTCSGWAGKSLREKGQKAKLIADLIRTLKEREKQNETPNK